MRDPQTFRRNWLLLSRIAGDSGWDPSSGKMLIMRLWTDQGRVVKVNGMDLLRWLRTNEFRNYVQHSAFLLLNQHPAPLDPKALSTGVSACSLARSFSCGCSIIPDCWQSSCLYCTTDQLYYCKQECKISGVIMRMEWISASCRVGARAKELSQVDATLDNGLIFSPIRWESAISLPNQLWLNTWIGN